MTRDDTLFLEKKGERVVREGKEGVGKVWEKGWRTGVLSTREEMKRISELNRYELRNVFEQEDLLYRLTDGQMAALGERLAVIRAEEVERGLFSCWLETAAFALGNFALGMFLAWNRD